MRLGEGPSPRAAHAARAARRAERSERHRAARDVRLFVVPLAVRNQRPPLVIRIFD